MEKRKRERFRIPHSIQPASGPARASRVHGTASRGVRAIPRLASPSSPCLPAFPMSRMLIRFVYAESGPERWGLRRMLTTSVGGEWARVGGGERSGRQRKCRHGVPEAEEQFRARWKDGETEGELRGRWNATESFPCWRSEAF